MIYSYSLYCLKLQSRSGKLRKGWAQKSACENK